MIRLRSSSYAGHGPVRLKFTTRRITRVEWRAIWRQLRIVNRETRMADQDCAIFGTGFLQTGPDVPDFIRRVHPSNVAVRLLEPAR